MHAAKLLLGAAALTALTGCSTIQGWFTGAPKAPAAETLVAPPEKPALAATKLTVRPMCPPVGDPQREFCLRICQG